MMTGTHVQKSFSKQQIPNLITSFRILGTLLMLGCETLSPAFLIIYGLCGFSDVLDGILARKLKAMSEFGAKLDSVADLMFYTVMVIKVWPLLVKYMPVGAWYLLWSVVALRLIMYIGYGLKYHKISSLHTYLNKLTGLFTFLIPYVIQSAAFSWYSFLGCSVAVISAVEELIIHICKKDTHSDVKSLYECFKVES